jgi:hypothetical protein
VATPAILAHRRGRLVVRNADQRWYTHTVAETLQKIDILTGRFQVPDTLAPLLVDIASIGAEDAAEVLKEAKANPAYFEGVQLAIVEVSTRRTFDLNGAYLHATSVQKFRTAENAADERDIIGRAQEYYVDFDRLKEQVLELASKFPRVMFYLAIERGKDLAPGSAPGRKSLNDFFRNLANGETITVFDPNTWIDAYGVKKALTDNNHFSAEYANVLSQHLIRRVEAMMKPKAA